MCKKLFKLFILFILIWSFSNTFAESNFEEDYTLIDCINWNDSTWVAFDSGMPYRSLKYWIEKTISYINTNVNKSWNEETASWKTFNIKVNCTWINLLDSKISLDFYWNKYNNELIIEWIWENSLIIKDTYFFIPSSSWNVVFINANFEIWIKYNYYFFPQDQIKTFYTSWLKIYNSNINLQNWYNLAYDKSKYFTRTFINWNRYNLYNHYLYNNQQLIYNSNIKINLDNDYTFSIPLFIKDSKIDFFNTWTWIYNINFATIYTTENNFSTIISNEINLWWNNFKTVNDENYAYINNKFTNFGDFIFWADLENDNKTIFINNFINNLNILDITKSLNLFNNVFYSDYIDEYDLNNFRKNYLEDEKWTKWIFWFFSRSSSSKNYILDISSASLYKEITWQEIPDNNQEIYIIYE